MRFLRLACNCLKYSGPRLAISFPPFRPSLTAAGSFVLAKIKKRLLQLPHVLCMTSDGAPRLSDVSRTIRVMVSVLIRSCAGRPSTLAVSSGLDSEPVYEETSTNDSIDADLWRSGRTANKQGQKVGTALSFGAVRNPAPFKAQPSVRPAHRTIVHPSACKYTLSFRRYQRFFRK